MILGLEMPMAPVAPKSLQAAMSEIVSPDPQVRAGAIDKLVALGASSTAALIPLAREATDDIRAAAMDAMARMSFATAASAIAASTFRHGVHDRDERVRSHAAQGLVRLGQAD